MRCRREGLGVCQGAAAPVTLVGGCTSPTFIAAQGGTFTGTTSGTNLLTGSCGSSGTSPEKVFQWTPTVSGTATIQTCDPGTSFDTVLYMRSGVCASGPEVAAGCNDDACPNSTGLSRASRITPSVTAGKTYFIVVDGFSLSQGNFTLTVTPPGASTTTTTTRPPTTTTTLRAAGGGCSGPTVIAAQGGTFSGTTSGTSTLAGSCGNSASSPERVYQWTPLGSGTATIQTCGAGTTFDTVLYMRSGACASGSQVSSGCNDDACPNASGLNRASRITPTVTAGQTYFIVVDGYSGAQGNFILTVTPPGGSTTTTLPALTTTTTRPATATTTTTTRASTSSTTTTLPPPTNLTATAPSCSEVDLRWTRSTGSVSGYNVYRKASTATAFALIKQVGASPVFPVADTAASGASAYTYGVTAWNSAGSSAMPTVLTNTPACPTSVNPTLVGYVPAVGIAKDVAVDSTRGVAYVASTEFGISTVNVSNPSNPVAIGGAIPPFDGEELAVSGSLGVAPVAGVGMEVFDLSTPSAPRLVGSLSAPVIHVALAGQTAYVAMVVSGNPAHVDLGVVNLTIPAAPSMIGRITLGPQVEKMRVVGSLLYVAAGSGGLQIVDVSSPTSPRILGAASISGHAYAVTVAGNFAYVAANTAIAAVNVAVPTAPVVVGTLGATAANAAAVVSTRLYVLDGGLLKIIDVSNPAAPLLLSTTDGFASVAIAVSGTQAFLASPSSIPPPEGGLYVLDVSSATAPTMLGGAHGGQYPTADVAVSGSMAVLSGQGTGMQVVNVSTPSAPSVVGILSGYGVQRVALAGHTAYGTVTVQGNPSHVDLVVVDLTVPTSPTVIGRVTLGADAKQLRVVGSLLYVAAGNGGLQIVDVSSPTSPRVIGAIGMPSTAYGVTAANGYAYVADLTSVQVVNVSTPSRPVIVGSLTATATAAAVTGSRLYVVNGSQLLTIDVTNPASPLLLSTTTVRADYVDMCGTLVCAGARALNHSDVGGGLYVLDLSVPTTPQMLSHVIVPGTIGGVAANSSMLYAADNAGMIDIVSLGP